MGKLFWGLSSKGKEENKGDTEGLKDSKGVSTNAKQDLFKKGLNKMADEELEDAIQYFDLALRLDPNFIDAWIKRGYCFFHLGNYSQAILSYDKALAVDPTNTEAWNLKALAYYRMKNYDKAIECVNRVIDLDPNDGMAWYNKACYLSLALRVEEAIDALKKAIEIDVSYAKKAVKDKDLDNIRHDIVFKRINEIVVLEAIRQGHDVVGKLVWVTGMNRQEIEEAINSLLLKGLIIKKEVRSVTGFTKSKEEQYELAPDIANMFTTGKIRDRPEGSSSNSSSSISSDTDPKTNVLKELLTCIADARNSIEKGDVESSIEHMRALIDPKRLGSILIENYPDIHRDLRFYHIKISNDGKNYLNAKRNDLLQLLSELEASVNKKLRLVRS
jgi:tetratricopeptide (TPR) repeat protein